MARRPDDGVTTPVMALAMGTAGVLIFCVLFIPLLFGRAGSCGAADVQPAASEQAANSIPGNYLMIYRRAGQAYGIPWNVLAGIGKVETSHGTSNLPGVQSGENFAGAGGPMQFLQPTWDAYGVDGDNDGRKDRYDPEDAIPGAANYLKASGAPGDIRKALYAYNHSWDYVDLVLSWAGRYAPGGFTVGDDNLAGASTADEACLSVAGGGPFGQSIARHALKWRGTPYLWGGGDFNGPTAGCGHGFCGTGFDCSGLALYAVYQASGGRIRLPHYTGAQWNDPHGRKVTREQLQPGDLVFFKPDLGHMGIYIGGGDFVHAPQTGDVVKVSPMSSRSDFAGAVRIMPPSEGGQ